MSLEEMFVLSRCSARCVLIVHLLNFVYSFERPNQYSTLPLLLLQVAQPVHVPPLIEIEKQFMTEFDYELEAKQLAKVRKNMMAANIAGDSSRLCAIPKPYLDLCTKRVLVMEELKGNKLVVELKKDMERQMERMNNSLGDDAAEKFSKEFTLGENGPSAKEYDAMIGLLNAKRRVTNLYAALYNGSVGWLPGVQKKEYESKSSLPINHAKLVDELLYIHGNQVRVLCRSRSCDRFSLQSMLKLYSFQRYSSTAASTAILILATFFCLV